MLADKRNKGVNEVYYPSSSSNQERKNACYCKFWNDPL